MHFVLTTFALLFSFFGLSWALPVRSLDAMPHDLSKRDNSTKFVVAHFMVGNSYPYTLNDWLSDIQLAHESGIDGFALNVGSDSWQPQQVASA